MIQLHEVAKPIINNAYEEPRRYSVIEREEPRNPTPAGAAGDARTSLALALAQKEGEC